MLIALILLSALYFGLSGLMLVRRPHPPWWTIPLTPELGEESGRLRRRLNLIHGRQRMALAGLGLILLVPAVRLSGDPAGEVGGMALFGLVFMAWWGVCLLRLRREVAAGRGREPADG